MASDDSSSDDEDDTSPTGAAASKSDDEDDTSPVGAAASKSDDEDDDLDTMSYRDLQKLSMSLGLGGKGTAVAIRERIRKHRQSQTSGPNARGQGYAFVNSDDETAEEAALRAVSSQLRNNLAPPQVPGGDLTEMVANMTDDWASSDDELNFAEESEPLGPLTTQSATLASQDIASQGSGLEFAESSAIDTDSETEMMQQKTSSGLEFAESSAVESGSDMEVSAKTSSGLEFAESSAVESDSAKEQGTSSGLGWAESSDYD